jgi:hypothetical protein
MKPPEAASTCSGTCQSGCSLFTSSESNSMPQQDAARRGG